MKIRNRILMLASLFIIWFASVSFYPSTSFIPQSGFGKYSVPSQNGWKYNAGESTGTHYVFINDQGDVRIKILKEPVLCESKQEFNKIILKQTQDAYKNQEFMEQQKQAAPYPCLGVSNVHLLKIKSKNSEQRRFILSPLIGTEMYSIEIVSQNGDIDPPASALAFISGISLAPGGQSVAEETNSATISDPTQKQSITRPNETVAATSANETITGNTGTQNTVAATGAAPQTKTKQAVDISSVKLPDLDQLQSAPIQKGHVPEVKFTAIDPCAPKNDVSQGTPWETSEAKVTGQLPAGVQAAIPAPIPDLDKLSGFNYNAAVSVAFEGMRLIYGVMPDDEAKKFEDIWKPLFDFPTQDIIDYLNKLNPLISQFLAIRETYVSNLSAVTMVLLDAGYAVELDDQEAWEDAMNESGLYGSAFQVLEKAMNVLAEKIQALGNPPNPVEAKCAAAENYRRMLPKKETSGDIGECWVGYTLSDVQAEGFETLYEPLFRHLLKVKVNGKEGYQIIELSDIETTELGSEYDWLDKIRVHQVDELVTDNNKSMSTENGEFKQSGYPRLTEFKQTGYMRLMMLAEGSSPGNEDEENYYERKTFSNTCRRYLARKQTAGFFFKHAMLWAYGNKWANYPLDANGMISDDAFDDFLAEMTAEMKEYLDAEQLKAKERKQKIAELDAQNTVPTQENSSEKALQDSIAAEEQAKQESIASRREIIESINSQIVREQSIRDRLSTDLFNAKDDASRKSIVSQINDIDMRIMGLQSTMQNEEDAVKTLQTGELVHTRQVFDNYARNKFIHDTHVHVARVNATRQIADRIHRQINLLPWEQREKAWELAEKYLTGEALVSGDYENALKLRNAFNSQIQGSAEFDYQMAKVAESEADENEFIAQTAVMAGGVAAMGVGSAGLVNLFGAEAAATIYGTQALGAVYGGATGYLAGGAYEGLKQAAMFWSPNGAAITEFTDAYIQAGKQKGATTKSQLFEGIKSAGTSYLVGMGMQWGVQKIVGGSMAVFGSESRLFKPVLNIKPQVKLTADKMRTAQNYRNAADGLKALDGLKNELQTLRSSAVKNPTRIQEVEKEISQYAAALNGDYYAKWQLKYKADPELASFFDRYVQRNYRNMTPDMVQSLKNKGYIMDHIDFKQFRNPTSAGTASMDLDLGPIDKFTGREPTAIYKSDGTKVDIKTFMNDAQASMNETYRKMFGINAPMSDMNLVTSAHKEAFSTTKLLDKNVDFNTLSAEEIGSVGKVLKVKVEGIEGNKMLTNTTKLQAKCREASKEIDNMLIKKLDADLKMATPGSFEHKQIQAQQKYWTNMNKKIKAIGTQESDPIQISKLNQEISMETGGKDVNGVLSDLMSAFGH